MRPFLFATLLACVASTGTAQAAFIVTVDSPTVATGSSTALAVWIHSDTPTESLATFSLTLRITPMPGAGGLQFAASQASGELADAQYVLNGDSLSQAYGAATSVTTTVGTNDTYSNADGTLGYFDLDGNYFGTGMPVGASKSLLAIVDLDATTAGSGGYKVTVVTGESSFAGPDGIGLSWSAGQGTVTVTGAANPAPAPPGLVLALTGVVPMLGWVLRRRWLSAPAGPA